MITIRYAFAVALGGTCLAGCTGGSLPAGTTPSVAFGRGAAPDSGVRTLGPVPFAAGGARPVERPQAARPWMDLRAATIQKLLYVSNLGNDVVYVYSWPFTKLVGKLTGFVEVEGMCADKAGDVFIANEGRSEVLEYAHGGTQPIATLADSREFPVGCSIDPTTGNLAVTNIETTKFGRGSVAIYTGAKGTPKLYTDSGLYEQYFCGYDSSGNLFVDGRPNASSGFGFAELLKGGSTLRNVTLDQSIGAPGGVQWDGRHVAVGDQTGAAIYQFTVDGKRGTEVGSTPLTGSRDVVQFWIERAEVIGPDAGNADVPIWSYPAGGTAIKTLYGQNAPVGSTVSIVPRK